MKNKILLISNSFWYFYNFRYDLIQTLLKNNYEIYREPAIFICEIANDASKTYNM